MQKKLSQYAYLGGLVCVVIAIVWRAAAFAGLATQWWSINYTTFYKGALLLLVMAIASEAQLRTTREA